MTEEDLPVCPSFSIRQKGIKTTPDTICGRCLEGTGLYLDQGLRVKLVCSYYDDTFVPNYYRDLAENNLKEYLKRVIGGRKK